MYERWASEVKTRADAFWTAERRQHLFGGKRLLFDPVADYAPPAGFLATLRGFFLIGEFPFLPWGAFPLIGYAVGLRLVRDEQRRLALPFLLLFSKAFVGAGECLLAFVAETQKLRLQPRGFGLRFAQLAVEPLDGRLAFG